MRIELKEAINKCSLLVDRDNSFDYESFQFALDFLMVQKQHSESVMILYGKCYYDDYSKLNTLIEKANIKNLIIIGECWRAVKDQFRLSPKHYKNANEFIANESRSNFINQVILLKGAQSLGIYNIERFFQEANQRTFLEVDLNALVSNLSVFKKRLRPETKTLVVVKASSYGNGSYQLANVLEAEGVDYLAVSNTDEGVELRNAGITLPIIVQTPLYDNFELIIENRLEPALFSLSGLKKFINTAQKSGQINYPVHIHLDTGLNRLGFSENETKPLLQLLNKAEEIELKSIFSDLADSGNQEKDAFTKMQLQLFENTTQHILSKYRRGKHNCMRHILNSDGIIRFNSYQYEMVRLGLGIYGINRLIQQELNPISSLKSTVSQVKNITNGIELLSPKDRDDLKKIAIIPVGYADGINRDFGKEGARVLINGTLMPIVSKVSMDMMVVNTTGFDVKEGDEVVLFGKNFSIIELAELHQTEAYVILAGISKRVRRIYFKNRE